MICISCNKALSDNAKFCNYCGALQKKETEKRFCPTCKKIFDPDSKFCDQCGTALIDFVNEPQSNPVAEEPKTIVDIQEPFEFKIEDVFTISGKGTVIVGVVKSGTIRAGYRGSTTYALQNIYCVNSIEKYGRIVDSASEGEAIGLFVDGKKSDFMRGTSFKSCNSTKPVSFPAPTPNVVSDLCDPYSSISGTNNNANISVNTKSDDCPLFEFDSEIYCHVNDNTSNSITSCKMRIYDDRIDTFRGNDHWACFMRFSEIAFIRNPGDSTLGIVKLKSGNVFSLWLPPQFSKQVFDFLKNSIR